MKLRWVLWLVLLLSVGVNLGVLVTMRRAAKAEPVERVEQVSAPPASAETPSIPTAAPAPNPPNPLNTPTTDPAPVPAPEPRVRRAPSPAPQHVPAPVPEPVPPPESFPSAPHAEAPAPAQPIPGPRFDRVADELRLRPEQRGPFIELQRRHFDVVRVRREELNAARRLLSREFLSGAAEQERVRTQLAEVQRRQRALDDELAQLLLDAQTVLDEPQQRRFAELVLERIRNREMGPPQRPGMGNRRGGPMRRGVPPRQRP